MTTPNVELQLFNKGVRDVQTSSVIVDFEENVMKKFPQMLDLDMIV